MLGRHPSRLALFLSLLASLVLVAAATAAPQAGNDNGKPGAGKGHGKGLILKPRPGQRIKTHRVRLVVRSGPERNDLKARLNGVAIGARFAVKLRQRQRVLDATLVDGLRRGRNVLRIRVRGRHGYRQRTIRFFVVHHKPLTSAGTDRRVIAGTPLRLQGMTKLDRSDEGRTDQSQRHVRWELVGAPRRSSMRKLIGVSGRPGQPSGLSGARTLTPTIKPDVPGRYKIKLTTNTGNGTTVDWSEIYVVRWPLVTLETAVPPAAGEKTPQPGIQLAGEVLRAPFMRVAGGEGTYSGKVNGIEYRAMWQLVALDRRTAAVQWNRTYGGCSTNGAEWYPCYQGENGSPDKAELSQELSALGAEYVVIAASHPSTAVPNGGWGVPNEFNFVEDQLGAIGVPGKTDPNFGYQVEAARAGEMAAVGVPGLAPGQAKYTVAAGLGGLAGYLGTDSNRNYTYVPKQRAPFNTRAEASCSEFICTVAQEVGGNAAITGSMISTGSAGFLVAGYSRQDLSPIENATFATATGQFETPGGFGERATEGMASYINGLAAKNALVVITSIHGPSQTQPVFFTPGVSSAAWGNLTDAIASIGGTKERLNVAAVTPGSDYTLVGYEGLAEDEGQEVIGAGAHLVGAFVPDDQSLYEPIGTSSGEAPPELLVDLVLEPPSHTGWPDEGNKEVEEAIFYFGQKVHALGLRPRDEYWTQIGTGGEAGEAERAVRRQKMPAKAAFSETAFEKAKEDLEDELGKVGRTRTYIANLAAPAGAGLKLWEAVTGLSASLEGELQVLKERGEVNAEYLGMAQELLELLTLGAASDKDAEDLERFLAGAAIAAGAGQTFWNASYGGVSPLPDVKVKADELGTKLALQGQENEAAIQRMGDIIVSDWSKLQIVGEYGGCDAQSGDCGENNEYAELAWNKDIPAEAKANTQRAFDRQIYEQLIPVAYPIWNMGTTHIQPPNPLEKGFFCYDWGHHYPLEGALALSYFRSLEEFSPLEQAKTWSVYMTVARSGLAYGWPSEAILKRMFEPLPVDDINPEDGGLAMEPGKFMRTGIRINKYESGLDCKWSE